MTDYITFEDLYLIINISFVYLGLGECFQTRERSRFFRWLQTLLFIYMTVISSYDGVTGIYMFFFLVFGSGNEGYSIEDAATVLPTCLLVVMVVMINVIIFINKEKNKEIIKAFKAIYPKDEEIDEETRKIMMNKLKPMKRVITFYSIYTNLQPLGFFSPPVYFSLVLKKGYKLPFILWYPYDFKTSLTTYLFTLYTQFLAGTYTTWSLAAVDCGIVIIVVNISLQLELLGYRLKTVAPEKKILTAHEIEEANKKLNEIIKLHIHVIKLLNKLQDMYSLILFIKFVMTAGLICQCLFSIMISSFKTKINFALFVSSMLIQLFIICWYGQEIKEKSEELCLTAYECNWTPLDERFKRKIVILQSRSQIPLELNAMGFANVSLNSFTSIVKAGWSYFSITRQMYNSPE